MFVVPSDIKLTHVFSKDYLLFFLLFPGTYLLFEVMESWFHDNEEQAFAFATFFIGSNITHMSQHNCIQIWIMH